MASKINDLPTDVIEVLVQVAYQRALLSVGFVSRQLADAMAPVVVSPHQGFLYIPQYFAVYVHDGTGPTTRGPSQTPFIWYRNPADDPRLDNGLTPHRVSLLRHLTREDMKSAAFRAGVMSGEIVITRRRAGTLPNPFFEEGMSGVERSANAAAGRLVQDHFKSELRDVLDVSADLNLSI